MRSVGVASAITASDFSAMRLACGEIASCLAPHPVGILVAT